MLDIVRAIPVIGYLKKHWHVVRSQAAGKCIDVVDFNLQIDTPTERSLQWACDPITWCLFKHQLCCAQIEINKAVPLITSFEPDYHFVELQALYKVGAR